MRQECMSRTALHTVGPKTGPEAAVRQGPGVNGSIAVWTRRHFLMRMTELTTRAGMRLAVEANKKWAVSC
jgi:hypothetical protein